MKIVIIEISIKSTGLVIHAVHRETDGSPSFVDWDEGDEWFTHKRNSIAFL